MRAMVLFVLLLASSLVPLPATACTCMRPPFLSALGAADVVADIRVLEVRADQGPLSGRQAMLYRIERIFKGPPDLEEGSEVWVSHHTCTSMPYPSTEVGGRRIWFMSREGGRLSHDYCSTSLDSAGPLPLVLLQARARWLASR
ncbi:MAG: hypothetical protein CMN30_07430 [Sandaracinus sp.]|nr:hypothetical protein [Sandaracinus sp.]